MGKANDQLLLSNEVTPGYRSGAILPREDDAFFVFKYLVDPAGLERRLTVRVVATEARAEEIVAETPGAVARRIPFDRLTEDDRGAVLNQREAARAAS